MRRWFCSLSGVMRRFRPYPALFVAAMLVNCLVAWGCILWSPCTSHTRPSSERTDDGYPATIVGPYGEKAWWFMAEGFGVSEAVPSGARGVEGRFTYWRGSHTPAYFRGGWPMRSLQSTVTFHDYRARWGLPLKEIFRRGFQTSWLPGWMHAREYRRLALIPLWPGFAVNTILSFGMFAALRLLWLWFAAFARRGSPDSELSADAEIGDTAGLATCATEGIALA